MTTCSYLQKLTIDRKEQSKACQNLTYDFDEFKESCTLEKLKARSRFLSIRVLNCVTHIRETPPSLGRRILLIYFYIHVKCKFHESFDEEV